MLLALLPAALLLLTALPHCVGYHLTCTKFQRPDGTETIPWNLPSELPFRFLAALADSAQHDLELLFCQHQLT